MSQIEKIKQAIMADSQNKSYTDQGMSPLCSAKDSSHQYCQSGSGLKTQKLGFTGRIRVGNRLREWLGVDEDTFTIQDILQFCQ